jgi:hypothetical protein
MEPARPETLKGATIRQDAPVRILGDEEVDSLTAEKKKKDGENEDDEDAEETDQ